MKSNKFQLNTVYSAPSFNLSEGKSYANAWEFYANLYDEHPQDCDYPKARLLWKEHCEKYKTGLYIFFVPVKRTACYLTFSINGSCEQRFRIKTDENGLEYIVYDGEPLYAYDIDELSVEEATNKLSNINGEVYLASRYILALMHLEKYGYAYITATPGGNTSLRITTIEELDAAWKNKVA